MYSTIFKYDNTWVSGSGEGVPGVGDGVTAEIEMVGKLCLDHVHNIYNRQGRI